jgi:hypothetical protein
VSAGFGTAAFGAVSIGAGFDEVAPYVGGWEPFAGAVITRVGIIAFDVTDDSGRTTALVRAIFPEGTVETVFTENDGFSALYRRGSVRIPIAGGYRYMIRRQGGWAKAAVRIDVTATDLAGNVGTGQASFQ